MTAIATSTAAKEVAQPRETSMFFAPCKVRVLRNPEKALHPDGDRPLMPGDEFVFDDAINGNLYFYNRKLPCMQSISAKHCERVADESETTSTRGFLAGLGHGLRFVLAAIALALAIGCSSSDRPMTPEERAALDAQIAADVATVSGNTATIISNSQ